ncbi:MAG: hypothetical protein KF832_32110 [Caldilineaceae bacterium]|nr:hypothetical protein [Caldilineaceae bacterium]
MALTFWRDLSVIWLSLFCFIGLFVPVAALYFMVRGMQAFHGTVQRLAWRSQRLSRQVRSQVTTVSAQVDEQAVRFQGQVKRAETIIQKLADPEN